MSKDDRNKLLDDAPPGSKIKGVVSRDTGKEADITKEESYSTSTLMTGSPSSVKESNWKVNGETDPYFKKKMREVSEGTNKYYKLKDD